MGTVTILTPSIISKEILVILENTCVMPKLVTRDWEKYWGAGGKMGFKIGDTLTVRKPNRFVARTTMTYSAQDVVEPSTSIAIDKVAGVDFTFSYKDLTLSIEEFSDRYLKPAVVTIVNKIDYDLLQLYKKVWNQVGTPRTAPNTFALLAAVNRRLNEEGAPRDNNRNLIIDAAAEVALADAFKEFFNPNKSIGSQYEDAQLARVAGLNILMDQAVASHTSGTVSNTTPLIDTNVVAGNTYLHIDGLNGATVTAKEGDTFTIAGVYAVNPQTKQSTGVLKQFVVTADTSASGSEFGTIVNTGLPYAPAMYATGAKQNVTALPVDGDAVTFFDPSAAVSQQNIGFHKDAFALACVPLELPQGVAFAGRETYKGISVSITKAYDVSDHSCPCRIDALYGVACLYPELACRLSG